MRASKGKIKSGKALRERHNKTISAYVLRKFDHDRCAVTWGSAPGQPQDLLVEVRVDGKRLGKRAWADLARQGVPVMDLNRARKEIWPTLDAADRLDRQCMRYVRIVGWTSRGKGPAYLANALQALVGARSSVALEKLLVAVCFWRKMSAKDKAAFDDWIRQAAEDAVPGNASAAHALAEAIATFGRRRKA